VAHNFGGNTFPFLTPLCIRIAAGKENYLCFCCQAPYEIERRRQDNELERLQSLPEWKRNLIVKKRTTDAL